MGTRKLTSRTPAVLFFRRAKTVRLYGVLSS